MKEINETFADRLIKIRKERGYTQKKLEDISGISVGSIRRYEQENKNPNADYLLTLSEVLDVTPEYLLRGDEKMNNYTKAISKELKAIDRFAVINEIRKTDLNGVVLSHLSMNDNLVNDIQNYWNNHIFTEGSECYANYVREVIIRYCQNRIDFKEKYKIPDGMI